MDLDCWHPCQPKEVPSFSNDASKHWQESKGLVYTLDINNQKFKPTADLRILGVNINDQLSFTKHISDICKKASRKIGVLARLRNLISCKTKLKLYLTAILRHLTYCHFCKQSERRKLERQQERAWRAICYNCRADTYEDLLRSANLPSLYNKRLQEIVILMYQVRNSLAPDYIGELFNFANKGYSLRDADFDDTSLLSSEIWKTLY